MYISSATRPMNHLDALPLLLDSILDGGDVTLINEDGQGDALLDLAADCLAGLRSRILRAAEMLPDSLGVSVLGVPVPSPPSAAPSRASVPDDDLLMQGFQALTVVDPTCDRIVLLVSDAHALQHSILRYIQFVSRSGTHLQFVFCGRGKFFDLMNPEEFAWLRARLMAGLIVTLEAPVAKASRPIAKASSMSSSPPSVPDGPAARVGKTAVPVFDLRRPTVSARMPSRVLLLGALALLGLGSAAWFTLGVSNGEADGPATIKQAAAVIQPPTTPKPSAAPAPGTQTPGGTASHAASGANLAAPAVAESNLPVMAGKVQDAAPGSPSSMPLTPPSMAAPGAPVTVWPPTEAGLPQAEPNEPWLPEPLPGPARSVGQQGVPTVVSRTATAAVIQPAITPDPPAVSAPGPQIPDGSASHATSEASPAASSAQALYSPLVAGDVQGAELGSPSSMPLTPPSTAASGALIPALPQTKAGAPESEPNAPRLSEALPGPARSLGRQVAPAVPSRTAATAPGSRTHRLKELKAQPAPLPAANHWLAFQPASGSLEPAGGGSPQYIGSYATGANGVRMFHLDP